MYTRHQKDLRSWFPNFLFFCLVRFIFYFPRYPSVSDMPLSREALQTCYHKVVSFPLLKSGSDSHHAGKAENSLSNKAERARDTETIQMMRKIETFQSREQTAEGGSRQQDEMM